LNSQKPRCIKRAVIGYKGIKLMKRRSITILLIIVCSIIIGCPQFKGEDGEDSSLGEKGTQGPQGDQGVSAVDEMPCFGCITNPHIEDGAVDERIIEDGAVQSYHIADYAVGSTQMAVDSVTNAKFRNEYVVDGVQIADTTLGSTVLGTSAVTTPKLAPFAVVPGDIASDQINTEHIAYDSVHHAWTKESTTNDIIVGPGGAVDNCTEWIPIGDTRITLQGKGGAYLIIFNSTFDMQNLHVSSDAWVRLVSVDGTNIQELTKQSLPRSTEWAGFFSRINTNVLSMHWTGNWDDSFHEVRVEWKACGVAEIDTNSYQRTISIIEFARSEVTIP
jgi:hypothetical protein